LIGLTGFQDNGKGDLFIGCFQVLFLELGFVLVPEFFKGGTQRTPTSEFPQVVEDVHKRAEIPDMKIGMSPGILFHRFAGLERLAGKCLDAVIGKIMRIIYR
jgi:hypothetical protein